MLGATHRPQTRGMARNETWFGVTYTLLQRARKVSLAALGLALLFTAPPAQAQPADGQVAKLTVVYQRGRRGPNLRRGVRRFIGRRLRRAGEVVSLIHPKRYMRNARRAGFKRRELLGLQAAMATGKAIGASHVLLLNNKLQRQAQGRRRRRMVLHARLVDVNAGETVMEESIPLRRRRLPRRRVTGFAETVLEKLQQPAVPEPVEEEKPSQTVAAAEAQASPEPPAPPPPPETPPAQQQGQGETATDETAAEGPQGETVETEDKAVAAASEEDDGAQSEPSLNAEPETSGARTDESEAASSESDTQLASASATSQAQPESQAKADSSQSAEAGSQADVGDEPELIAATEVDTSTSVTAEASDTGQAGERLGRWRHPLEVQVGSYAFWRRSAVSDDSDLAPIRYAGDPLPSGMLSARFYPLALGGRGLWYEGFGVDLQASFTQVETVNQVSQQTATSQIFAARGGLSYRLVFWDAATAPDFELRAGYSYFSFPLEEVQFPGVSYGGAYVGGDFAIPLTTPMVVLDLGGQYVVSPAVTGSASDVLGTLDSSLGFRARLGVRVRLGMWEIAAGGRFQQYSTNYSGTSTLAYEDAAFVDRTFGGYLTGGIVY